MGCASSKQPKCLHCGKNPSAFSRSHSVPLHLPDPIAVPIAVPQPALHKCDSNHIVGLTSSTLGSLKLDSSLHNYHRDHDHIFTNGDIPLHKDKNDEEEEEFSKEIRLAKTWSDMINQKIPKVVPKTPIRTPPGEPETINTWELMKDLEDISPLGLPNLADPNRCFSFHTIPYSLPSDPFVPKLEQENGDETPIPLWLQMSNSDPDYDPNPNAKPLLSDFDPEIISTFRKALEDISPTNTSLLRSPDPEKISSPVNNRWLSIFTSKTEATDTKNASNGLIRTSGCEYPPGGKDRVVIYYTSLRGVRKTYEDCCQVRVIMKGLDVRVDERDVSMHYAFREELNELLGDGFRGGLPRVFVRERYIGGVDEIKQLHEDGSLEKLVQGCRKVDDGGGDGGVCEACGDIRFVLCERCSGSCKIYYEGGEEEEEEEVEEEEFGFMRCPDCNENGIVRCPICCC
ncbi:uncharacterized protein At3g28850-like [Telopea speciosissima]|uniref:uncharacterized protein At3g28850-like n=1 Tax=Telopea speciosissima TaxID=54955 RepID=UPI001CC43731|nr:uncharacterized protein At3g28850-like [Telopea speciosissima]